MNPFFASKKKMFMNGFISLHAAGDLVFDNALMVNPWSKTRSPGLVERYERVLSNFFFVYPSVSISGVSSDLMHEWVEQKMGADGALALREFYEKHLV